MHVEQGDKIFHYYFNHYMNAFKVTLCEFCNVCCPNSRALQSARIFQTPTIKASVRKEDQETAPVIKSLALKTASLYLIMHRHWINGMTAMAKQQKFLRKLLKILKRLYVKRILITT